MSAGVGKQIKLMPNECTVSPKFSAVGVRCEGVRQRRRMKDEEAQLNFSWHLFARDKGQAASKKAAAVACSSATVT